MPEHISGERASEQTDEREPATQDVIYLDIEEDEEEYDTLWEKVVYSVPVLAPTLYGQRD